MSEKENQTRDDGIPNFRGRPCVWDRLGLVRAPDTAGRTPGWDDPPLNLSGLNFGDYRYLDAIQWPTGFMDRNMGLVRRQLPEGEFSWFSIARHWRMTGLVILIFETTRTRSVETVNLPGKATLRSQYHSEDPAVVAKAQEYLDSWASGLDEGSIPKIEAVLGRPYYELMLLETEDAAQNINLSVDTATEDIIREAVELMDILHVRPYQSWTSETELMVAAGRPGSKKGPWSRADIDEVTFLPSILNGMLEDRASPDLLDWSNARRICIEPECTKSVVDGDDVRLKELLVDMPFLRRVILPDSWSNDDEVLIRRLVKLGRLGYGLPQVRKPEYRDVHLADPA